MTSILVVEDSARLGAFVEKGLRAHGFTTQWARTGATGLAEALTGAHDLVVLDLGLPDLDGTDLLRALRAAGRTTPVVILTARDSVVDRIAGLSGGADDYLSKPFAFEELLARIRLRLRDRADAEPALLKAGELSLNLHTRRASVGGAEVDLTAREFALLETLIRNRGHVLSREQLLNSVWGFDFDPGSNVVDVYIRYLRRKVGADRIETVRGMGYRLLAG
ncbi:response regulator transcription factor [Amycolatopsis sp. CA-230715]|uniref:response regulator transcription factor n=1 Tax=Amycolatopsis sp. CA-230715 TaxID=2745196 RepID=UPI001C03720C|nr:response regulator transcription factor [Amycolatopsis sp. CA-230715]QWF83139.1 Transcriptional activator protein CopR [Amycolatopsis sp. CA-230715]